MKTHRVDLWICGHVHGPHGHAGKAVRRNGTIFLDVSSIYLERGIWGMESRVLFFR